MVLSLNRWKSKVAIVTGASSGIGAAVAERLATEGLVVVGLARRVERVASLAAKLSQKGAELHPLKCDLSKEEDILNAFKHVTENLGPVHILVNNAGVFFDDTLLEGDAEKWRTTLEVNVLGLSIATREAVRDMRANDVDGHIVHVNSIAGHKQLRDLPVYMYGASKYAVTSLAAELRAELNAAKSKIKISSVSPGLVKTEIFGGCESAPIFQKMPHLLPEDLADAILFVLSTPRHVQITELTIQPVTEEF